MTSEIRTNSFKSRAGLSTVTMTDSGPMFSGITTFVDNSGFTFGVGGGTSIFTPATNVLTFGTNNTEKVRIDANGNTNITGVTTAANFKTGVSNLHDVGLTLSGGQIDVGSNIKIGSAGVVTATSFSGDGSNLTGITGTTINNNANNRIITGSGTANTLEGESTLTYNGSGTLEISDSGSSYTLRGAGVVKHGIDASSSDNDLVIQNNKTAQNVTSNIIFKGSGASGASVSEKLRIASGGELIFAGDTDTFIDHPNANQIEITAGNIEVATFIDGQSNRPALLIDKGGVNNTAGGANYNSNGNSNDLVIGNVSSGNHGMTICTPSSGTGTINFSDGSGGGADAYRGSLSFEHANELTVVRAKSGKVVLRNDATDTLVATGGKIGIGIDSPTGKFAVSDGTVIGEINPYQSVSACYIGTRSNHGVILKCNAQEKIKIETNGNTVFTGQRHRFDYSNSGGVGPFLSLRNTSGTTGSRTGICFGIGSSNADLDGSDYGEGQIKVYNDSGGFGNMEFNLHVNANRSFLKIIGNGQGATGASAGTEGMRGGVAFGNAGIAIDRSWTGQPGIHVFNQNVEGDTDQSTFRFHGWNRSYASYPDGSGSDFGVSLVADGMTLTSDKRRKTDITTITGALNTVSQMRGVSFTYVNRDLERQTHMSMNNGKKLGFIAQEVIPLLPELILDSGEKAVELENGYCDRYNMDYGGVTPLLVEAIKELITKVETLEQENIALRARVTNLEGN